MRVADEADFFFLRDLLADGRVEVGFGHEGRLTVGAPGLGRRGGLRNAVLVDVVGDGGW